MGKLKTAINRMSVRLISDAKTRETLAAVIDHLAVRNGEIGDGDEAYLTTGDLTDGGYKAQMVANAVAREIASGVDKSGSPMFALADRLVAKIIGLPEWQSLFLRVGLLDAPDTTPGSLAYQMLAEARARGAAITTVTEAVQKEAESRASEVKLITAALDDNAAAIKVVSEAQATDGEAIAKRIETIGAAVDANAAAIQDEAEARADAVSAEAKRITTLVASTESSIGGIENALKVKASNDNALVEAINTLWAKVGSSTALVKGGVEIAMNQLGSVVTKFDQLQAVVTDPVTGLVDKSAALRQEFNVTNSRVDGMKGTWSIKLDLNGYVAGMSLNAVQDTQGVSRSNVLFNVETFAIGTPGKPTEVPFAIDTTTGLVGIRGDLVVRGSITGYQLAAESVDRNKVALKAIGGAQIDDLAVDTLQIQKNAVTIPVSMYADSTIQGTGESRWTDILWANFNMPQDGFLYANAIIAQAYGYGVRYWAIELIIDGVSKFYSGGESVDTTIAVAGAMPCLQGPHNVRVRWWGADNGIRISQRALFCQLVLR